MLLLHILLFLLLSAASTTCLAWQPDFILRVNETVISPDCTPRLSTVVNGTLPGPLLTFTEGKHYWIRVYNDVPNQNLTMHWHGLSQYTTPFSDGTPLASQWPIPPHGYFDYEFKLSSPDAPGDMGAPSKGTYFYHSHVGMQAMSAFGAIVIQPMKKNTAPAPVQWDEELVMLLSDGTAFGWMGEPQSLLVNGHALAACNATNLPSNLPAGTQCSTVCGWEQFVVKPGKKYRLRVIGATALTQMSLKLEGHNMTLFEADGTYLDPLPINNLEIASGQRYSVLIETPRVPSKETFWFNIKTIWRPVTTYGSATWTYKKDKKGTKGKTVSKDKKDQTVAVNQTPRPADLNIMAPLPNATFGWETCNMSPFDKSKSPPSRSEVTRKITLVGEQVVKQKGFRWNVSNTTLFGETSPSNPLTPFLIQYYTAPENQRTPDYAAALANGGLDPINHFYPARLGEVLDIVIQNVAGPSGVVEAHPWHFHGAKYWDMGAGPGNFSYEALEEVQGYPSGSPILRDTSIVYGGPGASYLGKNITTGSPGGWRLFRLSIVDPGAWVIHCHILPHMIMGMQTMLFAGAENLPALPASFVDEYISFDGGAVGNGTHQPTRTSYFELPAVLKAHNKSP